MVERDNGVHVCFINEIRMSQGILQEATTPSAPPRAIVAKTRGKAQGSGILRRQVLTGLIAAVVPPAVHPAKAQFRMLQRQFIEVAPAAQLPPVKLGDLNGRPATLAPVRGKVLLINIWATWCEACRLDLPLFERFRLVTGDRVSVAAVSAETTERTKIKSFLEQLAIHHIPVYLDPFGKLASNSPTSQAPLALVGMPVTYLITPRGVVAGYVTGAEDWLSSSAQRLLSLYASP